MTRRGKADVTQIIRQLRLDRWHLPLLLVAALLITSSLAGWALVQSARTQRQQQADVTRMQREIAKLRGQVARLQGARKTPAPVSSPIRPKPTPTPTREGVAAPAPEPEAAAVADKVPTQPRRAAYAPVSARHGHLSINTIPWSRIIIDGRDTGRTTPLLRYKVAAGKHTVTLVAANDLLHRKTVMVSPGKTTRVVLRLAVDPDEQMPF